MWQLLLAAAAAAGSGILAKKLINPNDPQKPNSNLNKDDQNEDSIFHLNEDILVQEDEADDKIFRFASLETTGSKDPGKKACNGVKKNGGPERGKKTRAKNDLVHQGRNGCGNKVSVCLKKRRTGKHSTGKFESCASTDNSFGWGVGLGIMYMMSAGKAEMSKLNHAMDETAKTVQELKAEISKRKILVDENEAETNKRHIEKSTSHTKPEAKSKDIAIVYGPAYGPPLTEEGEYASSVLTDDQQLEVLEIDQLEAEFESELQKLPWCAEEGTCSGGRTDLFEAEGLEKEHDRKNHQNSNLYQFNGVSPAELDEKLCHLLIGQQGSQIVELETELQQAHSKLRDKEAELQALKDCVKRLTQFSLTSISDDETEEHCRKVERRDGIEEKVEVESTKSMVGMKRTYNGL